MFILKKGHQPGVYVPLRALFLVCFILFPFQRYYGVESLFLIWINSVFGQHLEFRSY